MPKFLPKHPTAGDYLPDFDEADAAALQALQRGDATQDHQQRALKWIIEKGAGLYEEPYKPTERDTNFALGRQYVGRAIVTLLNFSQIEARRRRK
jgi:hypothetical protein